MNPGNFEKMIPLVHNRLYKGGHMGEIWFVFRKNALTGVFQISGYGMECVFEITKGNIVNFSLRDQISTWKGDQALAKLKHLVRKSNVRFSVFVNP